MENTYKGLVIPEHDFVECTCGEIHQLDPNGMSGCSWISCTCGKTICKTCGSELIEDMEQETDEDYLWCCRKCNSCGTVGCGECV